MTDGRRGGWREMRVFISSTFRDMQAERDHLVRFVFPRLREELLERRIHFVDVDLRWGVTADQDAFELCMDEIDRCHPRFLCMLGGRYGWVPPPRTVEHGVMESLLQGPAAAILTPLYEREDGDDVWRLKQKPEEPREASRWTSCAGEAAELLRRAGVEEAARSITASEVFHGALRPERLDQPTYRYFYFRDPPVPDGIPPDDIQDYREPPGSFAETELSRLKRQVREATGVVQTAPGTTKRLPVPVRTYREVKELGEHVLRDLLASADAELGPVRARTPREDRDFLAEERAFAEEFVETRLAHYVVGSRAPLLDTLHEHVERTGGNGYLCVVGAPGSGKSALLARLYRECIDDGALVIAHFVGVNATNVRELLRRLCHELAGQAGAAAEDLPPDYDGLRGRFPELLARVAESERVVLLIDAVNQLDPAHGAHGMSWLPDELPPKARVVLSALRGPALDALRARREAPVEAPLRPLEPADANDIVDVFLARFRKELDSNQRELLLAKEDVRREGSPLYLLTALEELRTLGTYDEITDRIRELPGRARDLFHWILVDRLEKDDIFRDESGEPIGESLVRRFCSYLAIGRDGMSEAELVDLIAPGDPLGNVAALRALLRQYLMRRGELLDFFHAQLREAVEDEYLDEDHERLAAHRAVADYFHRRADPGSTRAWDAYPRGLSELPYHLTEGAGEDDYRWHRLYEVLTDFRFLERKAADVGAVTETDANGAARTTYTGVFMLQDDFDRALAKMPGGGGTGVTARRIVVTATDLGDGLRIRCPHCNAFVDFEERWRGREQDCPTCQGPWKVNDFVVDRPAATA
jgi:nephrocystin-3